MTRIVLSSLPPTVNGMYVNAPGKGRVKSREYAAWREAALWEIKAQKIKPIDGEVSIWVGLVAQNKRAQDCSNRLKSAEDLLVAAGIIPDDSNRYVRRVSAEWLSSGAPTTILIQPYEGSAA